MALNSLTRLVKKRKTIGRGGSRGGTSGRGHQGQGSRSGGSIGIVFEGGQMPLVRRLPKRGFNNSSFRTEYQIVNLELLETHFDKGAVVTKQLLVEKGLVKKESALVKILGSGELSKALTVHVDACSKSAAEAIKKHGGEVHIIREK